MDQKPKFFKKKCKFLWKKKVRIITGAVLALYITANLAVEWERRTVIFIEPFGIPKKFERLGLDSRVIADKIANALTDIEERAKPIQKDRFSSPFDNIASPKLDDPVVGLTLKRFIYSLRLIHPPKHVIGELILQGQDANTDLSKVEANVTFHIVEGNNRSRTMEITGSADDSETLARKTAEMLMREVNPLLLALYYYRNDEFEKALAVACERATDPHSIRRRLHLRTIHVD